MKIKEIAKSFIKKIILNRTGWKVLQPFSKSGLYIHNYIENVKRKKENDIRKKEICQKYFENLEVLDGPFKGLQYPSMDTEGSPLFPKLIGCYEKELWEILEKLKINNYQQIIDIGCAEGFYAIGLALKYPSAKVFAYDINPNARSLCKKMAIFNKVDDRVEIGKFFSAQQLNNFSFLQKSLIVSDCEGYEKELFTNANMNNLLNCDLIIEMHDAFDITISGFLKEKFEKTHNVICIKSLDDIEKAYAYDTGCLKNLSLPEKKELVTEFRGGLMEWLICFSKN